MDFRTDKLLHGGDYNPEQWLKRPDILEKDIDMLEESGCNVVSLGIFSWSTLEPEEGVLIFDGCRRSLINFIKEVFLQSWLHRQVQDPNGWQTSIRRYFV